MSKPADTGNTRLRLTVLPGRLAVCRLEPQEPAPAWAANQAAPLVSITRTAHELSIVCPEAIVPAQVRAERGWRAIVVEGPLDFSLTGILASLAVPLTTAGISLFALSTYDTDYVLVKETSLEQALSALSDTQAFAVSSY